MLDTRDFDLNAIGRVLATHADESSRSRSAAAKDSGPDPENAELRLEEFMQLLVQLAEEGVVRARRSAVARLGRLPS